MHQVILSSQFLKSAEKLDNDVKPKLKLSLDVLSKNPFDARLQTKSLSGKLSEQYSFRLGKDYRVVFKFTSDRAIFLLKVGNRKDIYR